MHFSFASVVLNFCFCLILTIDVSSSSSAPRAVPFTADKFAANHSSSIKATTNESTRQIFLHRNQLMQKKSFFGFLLVPCECEKCVKIIGFICNFICFVTDIICFFAAKGFWPIFPAFMQYQVNEMGKRVFSLSDDRIQQYCQGKFNFQGTCYRPGEHRLVTALVHWIWSKFVSFLQRRFSADSGRNDCLSTSDDNAGTTACDYAQTSSNDTSCNRDDNNNHSGGKQWSSGPVMGRDIAETKRTTCRRAGQAVAEYKHRNSKCFLVRTSQRNCSVSATTVSKLTNRNLSSIQLPSCARAVPRSFRVQKPIAFTVCSKQETLNKKSYS